MANIRVDLSATIVDGQSVTFRSPSNCSQITGLIVYYPENGGTSSKVFQFADAHGNNVGSVSLFAKDVLVKVILDTNLSRAYVQNADTNAYLEGKFDALDAAKAPSGYGLGENVGRWVDNPDTALQSGWYRTQTPMTGWMRVDAYSTTHLTQTLYLDAHDGSSMQRHRGASAWGAWEWVNPPLNIGVEYRTTERIEGKAVYKRKTASGRVEYRLDGKTIWHPYASDGLFFYRTLSSAGWYKIGDFGNGSSVIRLRLGGIYNSNTPLSSEVKIVSGYGWAKAITTVPTCGGIAGFSKIATVVGNRIEIYGYYNINSSNSVSVDVNAPAEAGFVLADFESAPDFDESSAESVVSTFEVGYLSMKKLWENASPNSSFAEQAIISVDTSKYSEIIILAKRNTAANEGPKIVMGRTGENLSLSDGSLYRYFFLRNNEIYAQCGYDNTTPKNDIWIPLRIYGIKGVN